MYIYNKLLKLALPTATRWASLENCFRTLLQSEQILYTMVSARDFVANSPTIQKEHRNKIKNIISSPDFVNSLKKAIALLTPIDALIKEFQSKFCPC